MRPLPSSAAASPRPLKILIAEDSDTARVILSALVEKMGHAVIQCRDGEEALARYDESLPDIVLTDVMMPRLDGFGLLREIRSRPSVRWVPVVFLTAIDAGDKAAIALNEGADDYMLKPIQVNVLQAKINAFARTLALQEETEQQRAQLAVYREHAETEKRFARRLMELLSNVGRIHDPLVEIFAHPAEHLSGDIVAAARTPNGRLHVLLADGTGHGLAAALNVLPTVEPFYSMTAKGFSVETILTELNRKLYAYLPTECYVAAAMLAFDPIEGTLAVWNGGMPDLLLVDFETQDVRRLASVALPLGILDPTGFEALPLLIRHTHPGLAVLASDGLVEALGEVSLERGVVHIGELALALGPERPAAELVRQIAASEKSAIDDDLTLVAVELPGARASQINPLIGEAAGVLACALPLRTNWSLEVSFGAQQLSTMDVVPLLHGFVQAMGLAEADGGQLFVVISELYNNALDHGLLLLSTERKDSSADLEAYFTLREERLARLEHGEIRIGIRSVNDEGCAALEITVADSGPGFNPARLDKAPAGTRLSRGGRGLALVRSLCASLTFRGVGNIAVARLRLSPHA